MKGETIVDVGANVGRLSQLFWDHGRPTCKLVSVEPVPANIAAIERRIRAARSKRWTLKKCAVSDHEGHVTMLGFEDAAGQNSVVTPEDAAGARQVACRRLETLVPDATVVKLDIEGHEYAVLPGAVPALRGVRAWALELHMVEGQPLEATLAPLAHHGFTMTGPVHQPGSAEWGDIEIPPTLTWDDLPGVPAGVDGLPGVFKMLHVIAKRD